MAQKDRSVQGFEAYKPWKKIVILRECFMKSLQEHGMTFDREVRKLLSFCAILY